MRYGIFNERPANEVEYAPYTDKINRFLTKGVNAKRQASKKTKEVVTFAILGTAIAHKGQSRDIQTHFKILAKDDAGYFHYAALSIIEVLANSCAIELYGAEGLREEKKSKYFDHLNSFCHIDQDTFMEWFGLTKANYQVGLQKIECVGKVQKVWRERQERVHSQNELQNMRKKEKAVTRIQARCRGNLARISLKKRFIDDILLVYSSKDPSFFQTSEIEEYDLTQGASILREIAQDADENPERRIQAAKVLLLGSFSEGVQQENEEIASTVLRTLSVSGDEIPDEYAKLLQCIDKIEALMILKMLEDGADGRLYIRGARKTIIDFSSAGSPQTINHYPQIMNQRNYLEFNFDVYCLFRVISSFSVNSTFNAEIARELLYCASNEDPAIYRAEGIRYLKAMRAEGEGLSVELLRYWGQCNKILNRYKKDYIRDHALNEEDILSLVWNLDNDAAIEYVLKREEADKVECQDSIVEALNYLHTCGNTDLLRIFFYKALIKLKPLERNPIWNHVFTVKSRGYYFRLRLNDDARYAGHPKIEELIQLFNGNK